MSERRKDPPAGAGAPLDRAAPQEHELKVRDLRLRFGAPEQHVAQCSCGWTGLEHRGRTGERLARRDGRQHAEAERVAQYPVRSGSPAAR